MRKNIPHPAGVIKYALGGTPEAWKAIGDAAREHRRALTERLSAGNTLTPGEVSILRTVTACAKLEQLAARAAEGGRA